MVGPTVSCLLALLFSGEPASSKPAAIAEETQQVKLGAHTFTLPKSLQIDLVAGPPLIERPIHADFDEQGRLYVAESSGSNDPVKKQLEEKTHRIVRLEDTDGDGKFDKRTIFADKMMLPQGMLFHAGSVYVAAPPSIWKLTDKNDDGIADERVEWFAGKTLTNCANDLHGPYLGPDGWIYWCKGAFAQQTYERPGKKPFVTKAAHIFRARPDGTGIEPVMTGGMDNPVEVAFTPGGERIFTTTFFQHPAGGKRDGLIHAIYGGVYGKIHNVIDDHPRTGEVLQPMTHMGPAAPAGLCWAEGGLTRAHLYAAQFNIHKVSGHVLEPSGATFKTQDFDLLTSDNLDFHPTDVLERGRNLLVVNTGGWYKLCCPSSQLWKPDILGGIYRIRRADTALVVDFRLVNGKPIISLNDQAISDLQKLQETMRDKGLAPAQPLRVDLRISKGVPYEDVVSLMDTIRAAGHPKFSLLTSADHADQPLESYRAATTRRATADLTKLANDLSASVVQRKEALAELERRGELKIETVLQFLKQNPEQARAHAIWALTRIGTSAARRAVRQALQDRDPTVVQAALNSVSLNRDADAVPDLLQLLANGSPNQRRVAAEALGRIGARIAVPELLKAATDEVSRELEHAIIYALIEIGDRDATQAGLTRSQPARQRVALIALDQMPDGGLTAETVAPFLMSGIPALRETAAWISARHPEWAKVLAPVLEQRIADERLTPKESEELAQQLAGFAKSPGVQLLLADVLNSTAWEKRANSRRIAWQAMSQAPLKSLPDRWFDVLAGVLVGKDPDAISRAVAILRRIPATKERWPALVEILPRVANQSAFPAQLRLDALSALPDLLVSLDDPSLKFVQEHLRYDAPVLQRLAAIDVISRSNLSNGQLHTLMFSLQTTGPYEFERLLTPYSRSPGDEVLKGLIQTLKSSPGIVSVPPEKIQKLFAQGSPEVQKSAAVIVSALAEATRKDREKIESVLALVPKGDVRRGQLVFHSQKATCTACHALGYVGGRIGPDLSRVGRIRTERDLVESIIFPSSSFVRSYEPIVVATKAGKTHGGLIKQESPEDIVVTVSAREEVRLRREEIEEIHPGTVSLMPSGLDQQMTLQELADLVVFLKGAK